MIVEFNGMKFPVRFWDGEILHSDYFAIDTETENIEPGKTPRMIILQVFDGTTSWLADYTNAEGLIQQFQGKELRLHNAAFDLLVLQQEFRFDYIPFVEQEMLWDTGVLFRLADLYRFGSVGRWALDYIANLYYGVQIDKNADLRMNWERIPLSEQPLEKLKYAALDPIVTQKVYEKLEWVRREPQALSHSIQLKGEIATAKIEKRGIGFDLARKESFLVELDTHINRALVDLAAEGYVPGMDKVRAFEQQRMAELEEEFEVKLPRSKTGLISTRREDIEQFEDCSEFIRALLEYKEYKKLKDFFNLLTSERIHPRFTTILNTGRMSCSSPNLQNLPRKPGVRECFVPKPGHVFVIIDYAMLELYSLAHTTYTRYGYSKMRELLNQGVDLHRWFAGILFNCEMEEVKKDQRQAAKACSFGYPGGLGPKKFITYSKNYGCSYNLAQATDLKHRWVAAFPEMEPWLQDSIPNQFDWSECPIPEEYAVPTVTRILRGISKSNSGKPYPKEYFKWVWSNIILVKDPRFAEMPYDPVKHFNRVWSEPTTTTTGRRRANANYNNSRNTCFQGLGADITKLACWKLDCHGLDIVNVIHDEVIIECLKEDAERVLELGSRLMIEAEEELCPGLKGAVEGAIKERWTK